MAARNEAGGQTLAVVRRPQHLYTITQDDFETLEVIATDLGDHSSGTIIRKVLENATLHDAPTAGFILTPEQHDYIAHTGSALLNARGANSGWASNGGRLLEIAKDARPFGEQEEITVGRIAHLKPAEPVGLVQRVPIDGAMITELLPGVPDGAYLFGRESYNAALDVLHGHANDLLWSFNEAYEGDGWLPVLCEVKIEPWPPNIRDAETKQPPKPGSVVYTLTLELGEGACMGVWMSSPIVIEPSGVAPAKVVTATVIEPKVGTLITDVHSLDAPVETPHFTPGTQLHKDEGLAKMLEDGATVDANMRKIDRAVQS